MSTTVTFFVPGIPGAKGRHRTTKSGHTYPDPKTEQVETNIQQWYMAAAGRPKTPWEGPVALFIEATFPWPKSTPKWKRERGGIPHLSRPDADNIAKTIDALNGVAWRDDSQCYDVRALKWYGESPGVLYSVHFEDPVARCVEDVEVVR